MIIFTVKLFTEVITTSTNLPKTINSLSVVKTYGNEIIGFAKLVEVVAISRVPVSVSF